MSSRKCARMADLVSLLMTKVISFYMHERLLKQARRTSCQRCKAAEARQHHVQQLTEDVEAAASLGLSRPPSEELTELAFLQQNSEAWLSERHCRLTTSELAPAIGQSRWSGPEQVTQQKQQALSAFLRSSSSSAHATPAMAYGLQHEATLLPSRQTLAGFTYCIWTVRQTIYLSASTPSSIPS